MSNPDIILGRALATFVSRIEHAARLDQHQLHLVLGAGLVLDPLRDDEHLARAHMDRAIAKIDPQIALDDDERLVGVFVTCQMKSPCNFTTLN